MFFRKIICRSNGKEYAYLKLIENYREGGKVKQRVIANLGNLDNLTPEKVEGLISGLIKVCGLKNFASKQIDSDTGENNVPINGLSDTFGLDDNSNHLKANKILRYGEILTINKIWEILDVQGAIKETFSGQNNDLNIALLVELMVINQIIKPQNKQVINDWHHFLYIPEFEDKKLSPHHFYRTLDIIDNDKEALEKRIFERVKGTIPVDTDITFCRLTTGLIEPSPHLELNASLYGKYFLEEPEEQIKVDLGILVSRDGMPFSHRIIEKTTDNTEYGNIVNYLKNNYGTKHCIFVGERNFTINPNLEALIAKGYEYLVRHKHWKKEHLELVKNNATPGRDHYLQINDELWFREVQKEDIRYLFCYNPHGVEIKREFLEERLDSIESELKALEKSADESHYKSFMKPFDKYSSVFKDEYCIRYFNWNYDKASRKFTYRRRNDLLELDLNVAGLYILETNSANLSGQELLESYINLSQIGEEFRDIKNFQYRPNKLKASLNISAIVMICALAAIIEKTLERIIRDAGINRQTLQLLEEIKYTVNQFGDKQVKSVSHINLA